MSSLHIRSTLEPPPPAIPTAKKVLVVDDLPEICAIFRDASRRVRGSKVDLTTEINSNRALDLVRSKAFDLVVSDFRMNEVDGIEVLTAARATDPRGYRILITGYNEIPASIERIKAARVDAYIAKPIRGPDLILLLTDFLQNKTESIEAHRAAARELEAQADPS